MEHYRIIKVKYLPATEHKGARISIIESRNGKTDRKVLSKDYEYNTMKEQAKAYLEGIGINIVAEGYDNDISYLMSDTWGSDYVDINGKKY